MAEDAFRCTWCGSREEPAGGDWQDRYCIDCGEPLEREPDRSYHEVTVSFVLPCAAASDPSDAIDRVQASSIYGVIAGDWGGFFFQWWARERPTPSETEPNVLRGRRRGEAGELLAQALLVLRGEASVTDKLKAEVEAYLGIA